MGAYLRRFVFSTDTSYVLELGEGYMRFYVNGQQILDGSTPVNISTPWTEAQVAELQSEQVGDFMRFVHKDVAPYILSRTSDTSWSLTAIDFDEPPFLDENLTSITITPSGTSGTITLTPSSDIFADGHVGSYWRIGHIREASNVELDLTADGTSSSLEILGDWEFRTYGNWEGDLLIQRFDSTTSTWKTVKKFSAFIDSGGTGSRTVSATGTADTSTTYRIKLENGGSGVTEAKAILESAEAVIYGFVKITAVGSGTSGGTGTQATATVKSELESTAATTIWAEGSWSEYRGFPRTIAVHEGRMVYGGNDNQPSTIWGSQVDDFDNFATSDSDSGAYTHTLAGKEINAIQWLASQSALLIGTSGSEWRVLGNLNGGIITADQIDAKQQSFHGSEYLPAINTGDAVLFVERKGRALREMRFSFDDDKFIANDLLLLSEHLAENGYITQTAWQNDIRVLWCVTSDGRLLGLTYDRQQNVIGWHPHVTDGAFRSVATIYSPSGENDEAWFVVERFTDTNIGLTSQSYVQPAVGGSVSIASSSAIALSSGDTVRISNGGTYTVIFSNGLNSFNGSLVSPETDPGKTVAAGETVFKGGSLFYVERFYPTSWTAKEESFFVDSGLTYSGSPQNTFGGMTHLANETIDVLADGVVYENISVNGSGEFSLPDSITASTVRAGLAMEAILSPYRIDADTQLGVHLGRNKLVDNLSLRLYRSCMPQYVSEESDWQANEPEELRTDDPDDPPLLAASEADDFELDHKSNWSTNPVITIKQDRPLPLTVLAMNVTYTVSSG